MSKTVQILFLIFSAIVLIASGYGLSAYISPDQWYGFNYYTVLSNAVCFVCFLIAFIWGIKQISQGRNNIIWRPRLMAAVTFVITVTFLIYMFLLAPEDIASGKFWNLHNIAVHYIVPIITLVSWLFLCPRGHIKEWDPFAWLAVPATYFVYIIVRAQVFGNIGPLGTPYPYGFIDVQKYGWEVVGKNAVIIMIGMIFLGYLFYSIDRVLSKIDKQ